MSYTMKHIVSKKKKRTLWFKKIKTEKVTQTRDLTSKKRLYIILVFQSFLWLFFIIVQLINVAVRTPDPLLVLLWLRVPDGVFVDVRWLRPPKDDGNLSLFSVFGFTRSSRHKWGLLFLEKNKYLQFCFFFLVFTHACEEWTMQILLNENDSFKPLRS